MTDLRKAAEMALEVFEHLSKGESPAITRGELVYEIAALRQALAMENFSEVNQEIEQALAQEESEVTRLRQVCRNVYEIWAGSEGVPVPETIVEAYLLRLIEQMRDEASKGLKPLYTARVDAVNISQEPVDETAKREHELEWVCCVCGEPEALGIVHSADAPCFHYTKREWVGLTDDEVESWRGNYDFFDSALVRQVEAKLKEKNT